MAVSVAGHIIVATTILALANPTADDAAVAREQIVTARTPIAFHSVVFIARDPMKVGGGGGGGGNQQQGPIRHAKGVGSDTTTLRVIPKSSEAGVVIDTARLPSVILDAVPLAFGTFDQIGLPVGGVAFGTSTGPGSGGGVGTGVGGGIGEGRGPGIGPGSGGGIGGGVYRPGGAVTAPRVIREVKPTYTNDALLRKIQGTVVLELVVTHEGRPSQIRVVRSLDEELDQQAVDATAQWRFDPGRLGGAPVDVLVTIALDFWLR
jgi:TonB family protein